LIAIVPMPFLSWGTGLIGRKNHESFKAAQEAFSDLNNKVQESVSGIRVTKSFGYQEAETQSFAKTNQEVYEKNVLAAKYDSLFDPLVLLFIGLSYVLTLIFGGIFISQGQFTIGELVTFITYLDMLVWPLQATGYLFNIGQRGAVSYERIEKLLAQESDVKEAEHPLSHAENGRLDYDIQKFSYVEETSLSDIHFSIEQGQTLGIVGQTGSGKTTLLRLLLREQDIQEGAIYLNGHDIREYRLKDLRRLIGYVTQEQMLFALSIRDNIRFANPQLTDSQVLAAAQLCGVYEDIQAMPEGLDTVVGERGLSLSGGQKQRLSMSRAIITNPEILILDDSLSAVDAKTEHLILENLKSERAGKTTIITAHRREKDRNSVFRFAKDEIDKLLSEINKKGEGFKFSNDFIMRTCLYLLDMSVALKVETFKKDSVLKIKENWDAIQEAIKDTVDLLNEFGFNSENMISYVAVSPMVYYRYKGGNYDSNSKAELRKYIVIAQVKQIFGTASNAALTSIREALKTASTNSFSMKNFTGVRFTGDRSLRYTAEEIDALFDTYEIGAYTFMLLSLLYPNLKFSQKGFHQDHMHPHTGFEEKKIKSLILSDGTVIGEDTKEDWRRRRNTLANLQLLEGRENEVKNATPLVEWLKVAENRENVKYLPAGISYELSNFEEFMEKRQELMSKALKDILL